MLGENLSRQRFQALVRAAGAGPRWLDIPEPELAAHYNRAPFLVGHRLAAHPLFSFEALRRLCHRLPRDALKYRFGVVPNDTHFDSTNERYRDGLALDDAIDDLVGNRAYIAVYNPERDPEYRIAIEALVGELGAAVRDRERRFSWFSTYVFISANDSVTPYHMDREMNFLFQIRGTKTVQLWDPHDDDVMRPAQRDHLFSHAPDARVPYHPGLAGKARTFELKPGLGVHHPFIAPHLVTTGPNLSISLAITFRTPRSDIWRDAHDYNDRLRRFGLGHIPVGDHPAIDVAKAGVLRALRGASAAVKGRHRPAADAARH